MEGKNYFNWLTEEEQFKWVNNFNFLNNSETAEDFLEYDYSDWILFICTSFEFSKTKEGESYWNGIYNKYKKYDNIKVKPQFAYNKKQPKIL
jgi:hypothetical protein